MTTSTSSAKMITPVTSATLLRRKVGRGLLITAFLAPALALFSVFVLFPVARALQMSLYEWNGFGPLTNFIGIDNFRRALSDPVFRSAIWHTLFLLVATLLVQLPLALALALLVRRNLPGGRLFQLIFFLPFVFSEVLAARIWSFLYQPGFGAVDAALGHLGVPSQDWLGSPRLVLPAIFVVATWKWVGLWMTLFIVGLNQIPEEVSEAATLDGASSFEILRYITLPMLSSTIRLATFLAILGSLQAFELVFVMTGGGPGDSSETIATYMYNYGFRSFELGYGGAVAILLFIGCLAFSLAYQRYAFRRDFALEGA